jgi:hypothetical protein
MVYCYFLGVLLSTSPLKRDHYIIGIVHVRKTMLILWGDHQKMESTHQRFGILQERGQTLVTNTNT